MQTPPAMFPRAVADRQVETVDVVASRTSASEDHAWSDLYLAVRQPSAAVEVVNALDSDPGLKRQHMALYLLARATMRNDMQHQQQVFMTSRRVRGVVQLFVLLPIRLICSAFGIDVSLVAAAIPAPVVKAAPAKPRVTRAKAPPVPKQEPLPAQAAEPFPRAAFFDEDDSSHRQAA